MDLVVELCNMNNFTFTMFNYKSNYSRNYEFGSF